MNSPKESPPSLWRRSIPGPEGMWLWTALIPVVVFVVVFVIGLLATLGRPIGGAAGYALIAAIVALIALLVIHFIRWVVVWRNCRRFLFGLAALATVVVLFYAEEDLRGKWAWDHFKQTWEAKGIKFDLTQVAPHPVPPAQNFAMAPIVASCYRAYLGPDGQVVHPPDTNVVNRLKMPIGIGRINLTSKVREQLAKAEVKLADAGEIVGHRVKRLEPPIGNEWTAGQLTDLAAWQAYYRAAAMLTNEFPVPVHPQSPAKDVLFALSKYDSAVADLRRVAERPRSRFPLDYGAANPAGILLPHLAPLKGCGQMLQLRASAELAAGQTTNALADVQLMFRLTDSIRTEPFLISQLVRMAMAQLTLQPIWEGWTEQKWSADQLATLEQALQHYDFLADYDRAIRGELALKSGDFQYLAQRPQEMLSMSSPESGFSPGLVRLMPRGWCYENLLRTARFLLKWCLPLVDPKQRVVSPNAVRLADEACSSETKRNGPYTFLEGVFLFSPASAVRRFAYTQTDVDLARVACALARYRLAHDHYPATLAALVPTYIDQVPHDIINGQPLHYRLTSNGQFLLYSVGWDEQDDGGRIATGGSSPPRVDLTKGDWVWPFAPARAGSR